LNNIGQTIRRWTLHHRSDKALQELAKMYNPYIQGWINYYGGSKGASTFTIPRIQDRPTPASY
jgi:RNA-directed DNA polymerase